MLDFFLYRLLIKEYLPETYEGITSYHQQNWFSPEDSSVTASENDGFTTKYNPVNMIANSSYGKSITLVILFILSSISLYISHNCKGPGRTMYMTYSFLFPITHFIILLLSKITGGKLIGCDYDKLKNQQASIDKLKTVSQSLTGGKYKKKYK